MIDAADHAVDAAPGMGGRQPLLLVVGALAVTLAMLRVFGVVQWSWVVVLAPFTVIGAATAIGVTAFLYRDQLEAVGARVLGRRAPAVTTTPPPDHLEPPRSAVEAGESILAEHPEILAALCHGFRMKKLLPSVLGQSLSDPWAVYQAAVVASPTLLVQLRVLAAMHTTVLARTKRKDGDRISDASAMRMALDAFRPCARKAEAGGGHPDCPFEHVTVIFGAESPNRDANLRSVAPRVRALLERQYPQLETARLSDGSQVKFAEWQRRASQERAEILQLRKERERHAGVIDDMRARLAEAEGRVDALNDAAEGHRRRAIESARDAQACVVADLRAAIERADRKHVQEVQRYAAESARLSSAHKALASERDALELALLSAAAPADDADSGSLPDLTGVRVLLVGGEPRQTAPLRDRLESLGAQLMHDDSVAAVEHVPRAHVVVFWIRYLSHPTYFGVRHRVRALKTPHCYWSRTTPSSLAAVVARTLASGQMPPGELLER
jgi:hypothetical protein